jgi:hypothetical protein
MEFHVGDTADDREDTLAYHLPSPCRRPCPTLSQHNISAPLQFTPPTHILHFIVFSPLQDEVLLVFFVDDTGVDDREDTFVDLARVNTLPNSVQPY